MARILVVDDEPSLVDTIRYNLKREGHEVSVAYDGVEALEVARRWRPDLIVLDVMLPKLDGFEVCRTLRSETTSPILMLTAKASEIDKVVGLEIGADDYLAKPFSFRELIARVRASLRRVQMLRAEPRPPEPVEEQLTAGDLVVDLARHEVTRAGRPIALKPKEFDLLAYLMRNRGRVLTRDILLQNLWGYEYDGGTRTVDVHIRGLREKIENDPSHPDLIQTVRGVGYRFKD
ncbi:MAG: response regulator transcription factor [Chloroflexota bacterium]|nr:response regulator transcription factor [Dehalococcoidia bacterium]MDW8254807.1 response regulator transcription factor [Chloroflexota bacterium]